MCCRLSAESHPSQNHRAGIRVPNQAAAKLLLEVSSVDRRIFLKLFRQIFDCENSTTLARRDARAATDALFRIDEELFDVRVSRLCGFGMDGFPQTDGNT
jgi:hypothetical protein